MKIVINAAWSSEFNVLYKSVKSCPLVERRFPSKKYFKKRYSYNIYTIKNIVPKAAYIIDIQ